jgi:6-phosphogluconolactonase
MTDQPATAALPALRVLPTPDEVAAAAATLIAGSLADAVAARGVAHWATTGGSSAPPIYRRLATPPLRDRVPWEAVQVWWGDDRFVPPDHPESNVLPLTQLLLASGGDEATSGAHMADVGTHGIGVHLHAAQLHPVPVTSAAGRGPSWVAARYAQELREVGPAAADGAEGTPAFDLVIVGVGPDGHLLSVFPGSAVWDSPDLAVAVAAPAHVEPHVARVTLHPRILGAARRVLVITTGAGKADVLARAWQGGDPRELPVRAALLPSATWLLDEAAAARLPRG